MKTLLLALALCLVPAAALAQSSGPFDPTRDAAADLTAAEHKATAEHKLILLDVGGNWCIWCRIFDKLSNEDPKLHDVLEKRYVIVHVNMSKENENKAFLGQYPKVPGYPHFFVLKSSGKLLISQDTSVFERTHKSADGYDPATLTDFFERMARK